MPALLIRKSICPHCASAALTICLGASSWVLGGDRRPQPHPEQRLTCPPALRVGGAAIQPVEDSRRVAAAW
jgi:hypothetical protein